MADETADDADTDTGGRSGFADSVLVQRTRKGDMRAYGLIVSKYQDRVFNMISRMCSNRAEAEELAQETFLKALERIGQFRGNSRFYTWLFRIAVNMTISHRRRKTRVRFQSLTGTDEFNGTQAESLTASLAQRRQPSPQAVVMAAETKRRILEAMEGLDDEFRLVVVLRDVEEMNYAEIAEVSGLPIGTVKSRLHRARCMLQEKLADLMEVS